MAEFPVFQTLSTQRWRLHASAVCFGGHGIILLGPPASGKSTHAAALIAAGGTLIGDDYLILEREDDVLLASPVPEIAGILALDGYALMQLPYVSAVPLTAMRMLAPYDGNPLAFTGIHLPYDTAATLEPHLAAKAFADSQCQSGATLPPDWIPQKAVNGS